MWYPAVPAESTSMKSSGASRAASTRNTPSAVGERQILPRQTNSIFVPGRADITALSDQLGPLSAAAPHAAQPQRAKSTHAEQQQRGAAGLRYRRGRRHAHIVKANVARAVG